MLWLTILIALLIIIPALAFVVWPLFSPSARVMVDDLNESRLADLVQRKDTILQSIKEIEFDLHTSKISAADFQLINTRLRHQAIGLMRQIDKIAPEVAELEEELEQEILRLRKLEDVTHSSTRSSTNGNHPHTSQEASASTPARFCHNCGTATNIDDRFCAKCGTALKELVES